MIYKIRITREPGFNPINGQYLEFAKEEFEVEANSFQEAHLIADRIGRLPFYGQTRRTYINGKEHFNENF